MRGVERQAGVGATCLALVALACSGTTAATTSSQSASQSPSQPLPSQSTDDGAASPTTDTPPTCDALPAWRYEAIQLPPEFAPSLPAGDEVLWFAPGMFDPQAADYFTYAFSITWSDTAAMDRPRLTEVLWAYYDGLMHAVAGESDASLEPTVVTLAADAASGIVVVNDAFTTGEPIEISLRLSGSDCLIVHATAKPSADNWTALTQADRCLCATAPGP